MANMAESYIVDNINELIPKGETTQTPNQSHTFCAGSLNLLPLASFRAILSSTSLVLVTRKGNPIPGTHREFHLLALAWGYASQSDPALLPSLLDCLRLGPFLSKQLSQPSILLPYLKSKFQDYEEIQDRMDVFRAVEAWPSQLPLKWSEEAMSRQHSEETFYLYDPRVRSLVRQGHPQFDQNTENSTFDLSCEHFDQNITKVRLFTQESHHLDLLKKITLTFCDGSEKTAQTVVGNHNSVQEVDLVPEGASRHVLLVSGPWVADPLELLLGLQFLLSDGQVTGFRHQSYSLDRSTSVLDFLPPSVHAGSLRWVGLCGSVLDTSTCGDSIICNLKLKFASLCDQD